MSSPTINHDGLDFRPFRQNVMQRYTYLPERYETVDCNILMINTKNHPLRNCNLLNFDINYYVPVYMLYLKSFTFHTDFLKRSSSYRGVVSCDLC